MASTPNLDKMIALGDEKQTVQDFIDWYVDEYLGGGSFAHVLDEHSNDSGKERVMAAYFGIDLKKAEEERMAVLNEVRQTNHMRSILQKRKARV